MPLSLVKQDMGPSDPLQPTSGDLRLLTYFHHCPGWASVRWLAKHTTMSNRGVIESLARCKVNLWLDRNYQVTSFGAHHLPTVLTTPGAHQHLLRTWTAENSFGLRALIVALHAQAEGTDDITSADVARWLDINRNAAASVLGRWSRHPQGLFVVQVRRGTWRLVNPLVLGGSDADTCGSAHDLAVQRRNDRLTAEMDAHARGRARWLKIQHGDLEEQSLAAFADYDVIEMRPYHKRQPLPADWLITRLAC